MTDQANPSDLPPQEPPQPMPEPAGWQPPALASDALGGTHPATPTSTPLHAQRAAEDAAQASGAWQGATVREVVPNTPHHTPPALGPIESTQERPAARTAGAAPGSGPRPDGAAEPRSPQPVVPSSNPPIGSAWAPSPSATGASAWGAVALGPVVPAGAPKPSFGAPPPLPSVEASAPPGAAPAVAGTSASAAVPPPPPLEPPATNANPTSANPTSAAPTSYPPALDTSRFGAPPQMPGGQTEARPEDSKRVLAGVLAILFGFAGLHKFVLGYREAGAVMLLVTFVGSLCTSGISLLAAWVVGVIEGIVYLSKSDAEFVREYQVGRREWF
ncbi:MAG: hypothetical protein RIR65_2714 [Planctomycetota bacterium]